MGEKNFPFSHLPRCASGFWSKKNNRTLQPDRLTPTHRPDAAPHPSSAPFPLCRRRRGFLQSGEGRGACQWIRSLQPDEKMPRIPLIKFPKRNLKAPSPSTPGAPSCFPQSSFSFLAGFLTNFLNFLDLLGSVCLLQQHRSPRISTRPSCPAWVSTRSLWVPWNEHCLCEFV
jgi:hypothetical protein